MQEDVGVFQHRFHALRIGHEVGRQVTAVELHAFHDLQRRFHALRFFHGDDAVFTDFIHGFGNDVADGGIVVGGNGSDLGDLGFILGRFGQFSNFRNDRHNRVLDPAFDIHRIGAGGDVLHAFAEDRLGQNRRRGRAVTGVVTGFARHFVDHLRAHVLERVLQFDFLGHGHAVLGDDGRAELLVDHHVAALRPQRQFHGVCQLVDAVKDLVSCFLIVNNLLRHLS